MKAIVTERNRQPGAQIMLSAISGEGLIPGAENFYLVPAHL